MSMTYLQRLKRLLPVLIGAFILVVVALLPISLATEDDTSTLAIARGDSVYTTPVPDATLVPPRPIGGIFAGVTVAQEFPTTGTEINAVALVLATYQRANSGTIQVTMQTRMNDQWQTLGSRTVEKATLRDNVLNTVTFDPPLAVKRGQTIRIVLRADGDALNAISWWVAPSYQRPGFSLFLNDDPLPGTAQFQVSYARASGRLAEMIGPVWSRGTVFLDPFWRIVLAVGILLLLGSFLALGRYLPDRAAASSRERLPPAPVQGSEERVLARVGEENPEIQPDHRNAEYLLPDLAEHS
jgi:hypothetical protein